MEAEYTGPSIPHHPSPHAHYHYTPAATASDPYNRPRGPSIAELSLADSPPGSMNLVKAEFGAGGNAILYSTAPPAPPPIGALPVLPPDRNGYGGGTLKGYEPLVGDKKYTKDGQPAKRRGPKPDSKPAQTRKQELNRQAQRSHRQRKENYIRSMEDELQRIRLRYNDICDDNQRLRGENHALHLLLQQNGVRLPPHLATAMLDADNSQHHSPMSVGAFLGGGPHSASTHQTGFTPSPGPAMSVQGMSTPSPPAQQAGLTMGMHHHQPPPPPQLQQPPLPQQQKQQASPGLSGQGINGGRILDYDQIGVDVVLTLERPCMDHMPWLLERSGAPGNRDPCGHALMASCPPVPFSQLTPEIPFGTNYGSNAAPAAAAGMAAQGRRKAVPPTPIITTGETKVTDLQMPRTWELSKADLTTLLDLSKKLDLDGEITPVMAWGMILAHPRLTELEERDFKRLAEELTGKVRCYGFGAVLEEFEVRDALEAVLSTKSDMRYRK